ncbi:hypothetical protein J421_1120 [Gemmatirosa kalamazoonensis]|uniref:Uncharacterized protein n=1 Tax=Gemmatirosa kalamazoonensis TaxID=861299 RepID=W0RDZ7_9BACT|nr:lysyl oxidase family protein [Gemmatirosa kalamazoonensis]AHG88657.1 hypothetical protein J421_1120 [Gemmatirosa kalamazoonensis]
MRPFRLALLAVSLAGCVPDAPSTLAPREPSLAAAPGAATLKNTAQPVPWSGTALRDGVPNGEVPECAAVWCDRFDLAIDLPSGAWSNKPGGVEIAVRWSGFGNNLKLYVYRGSARVAASEGIIATAQSVLLPAPANGAYRVYVAYDFDMAAQFGTPLAPEIPYEALAEVEYAPKPQPTRALLPDLQARAQRNVTFDVPPAIFFEAGVPTTSCFPSEIAEEGARLCMRFDQVLANAGEGPLEFRFLLPADPMSQPTGPIEQRVYHSDGSVTSRAGGTWEFHPTHQHFHYTGFALSRLFATDASGKKIGTTPLRARRHRVGTIGAPASTGRKVSFCIVDIEIDAWGEKGDAPRTYSAPACLEPTPGGYLLQGLSAGWADVYDWFLPDQYLDVYGLADGLYVLETVADPDDTILEANESNNCGAVYVRLTGMTTASPHAALLGPGPACSR